MPNFQNSKQYLEVMSKDPKKHINVIALFAQVKGCDFENYDQIAGFIKRHARAAKELRCYDLNKIKKVLKYLLKTADYKVDLHTVLKYIDEPQLDGEKPIITLKNGEKIYDTARLKILEQDNRIYWDGIKWLERSN